MEETHQRVLVVARSLNPEHYESLAPLLDGFRRVELLHVLTKIPACFYQLPTTLDLQQEMFEEAWEQMGVIGDLLGVPAAHQWVEAGSYEETVTRFSQRLNVALILAVTGHAHTDRWQIPKVKSSKRRLL